MYGPCAVVVLLTILLLDDLSSISSSHSHFNSPQYLFQPSAKPKLGSIEPERGRLLRWSGAKASPLLHQEPFSSSDDTEYHHRGANIQETSSITDTNDENQARQRWRASYKNESDDHFNEDEFTRGAKVPMGWADPRLKGGRMLDVSDLLFASNNYSSYCEKPS